MCKLQLHLRQKINLTLLITLQLQLLTIKNQFRRRNCQSSQRNLHWINSLHFNHMQNQKKLNHQSHKYIKWASLTKRYRSISMKSQIIRQTCRMRRATPKITMGSHLNQWQGPAATSTKSTILHKQRWDFWRMLCATASIWQTGCRGIMFNYTSMATLL